MSLETINIEHVPSTYRVYAALFKDVQNSSFLHSQLLARNTDFEYAFVDATALMSRLHLLAATFRAISNHQACTLKTPNLHSEVVLSMSASNNVWAPPEPSLVPVYNFPPAACPGPPKAN